MQKLRMDLCARRRLREAMDPDTVNLIDQLCTRAGMLMEDASPVALTMRRVAPEETRKRLDDLARAAGKISRLISAAQALSE